MYSKEELNVKKYGDLLKILKKLGVKVGRQKTEKVIELILKTQKTVEDKIQLLKSPSHEVPKPSTRDISLNITTEDLETSLSKDLGSESDSILKTPTPERKPLRVTRSVHSKSTEDKDASPTTEVTTEISVTSPSSQHDSSNASDHSPVTRLSRSNTFVLEDSIETKSPPAPNTHGRPSLDRSATFTLESSDGRQSPKKGEEDKRMSLVCREIQTAHDIESIEKSRGNTPPPPPPSLNGPTSTSPSTTSPTTSPSTTSSLLTSPSSRRKTMRRSLRGQLLESKVSLAQRTFILPSSPLRNPVPSPQGQIGQIEEEKEEDHAEKEPPKERPSPSDKKSNAKSAEKNSKQNREKPVTSATQIPRFVNFARSMKVPIKVPDFAKIHQKAFNRMEALDEYVDRKRTRTNSNKEGAVGGVFSAAKNKENKTPAPSNAHSTEAGAGAQGSSALSTATPKRAYNSVSSPTFSSSKTLRRSTPETRDKKPSSSFSLSKVCALPKLVNAQNGPMKTPSITSWNKNEVAATTPGSHQRRNSYVPSKNSSTKLPVSFRPPVVKHADAPPRAVKGPSGVVPSKVDKRKETFKLMARKEPKVKSRAEIRSSNKDFIKGVRMNRRFELLMAKRGIQI